MKEIILNNNKPTERIRPSLSYCIMSVSLFIIATIVFFFAAIYVLFWFAVPALILVLMTLYRYYFLRNTLYLIDDEVIKVRTGIFSFTLNTLELYRVKDYVLKQSLYMRFFKIMNLFIYTTEHHGQVVILKGIPVSNIADRIRNYVQEARRKSKIIEFN